jgi:hypothetical protein
MIKRIIDNRVNKVVIERKIEDWNNALIVEEGLEDGDNGEEIQCRHNPVYIEVTSERKKEDEYFETSFFLERDEAAALRDFIDQLLKETE